MCHSQVNSRHQCMKGATIDPNEKQLINDISMKATVKDDDVLPKTPREIPFSEPTVM